MSTIDHSSGVGGLNWVKLGPRNCWMTPVCVCTARQLKHETHRHTKYVIIIKWFEFTAPFYTLNKTATFNSGHGVSKLVTQDYK